MKVKKKYKGLTERAQILVDSAHMRIIEEGNHSDEDYIVFTDEPKIPVGKPLAQQLVELEG